MSGAELSIDCAQHGRDLGAMVCAHYKADLSNARAIVGAHMIAGPSLFAHCAACEQSRVNGGSVLAGGLVCRHCLIDILDPEPNELPS